MKVSLTLGRYLVKTYLINALGILLSLLAIIYLFDTIELIRRASKEQGVPLGLVLQMGLLKLPEVGQVLFPFAILFSAMLTFWQLNRRSELVVLRSSGFSVWQFLMPLIFLAILIGYIQIGVINPVGSVLIGKYEQLESRYLNKQSNQIALFKEGLWLRQDIQPRTASSDATELKQGYIIFHARKIEQISWILKNVTVLYFGHDDKFLMRLDAEKAMLTKGQWRFENVKTHYEDNTVQENDFFILPTNLTIQDIEDSFSSPESMSFWDLPNHIQTLEETGFDSSRLQVHYHNLLSQPLFLAAMVLLAATVSIRPPRFGGTFLLLSTGIMVGFFVFFMSSYLQALGYSQQIPPILAAWSPAIICILLGLTTIMNLEDG